MGKRKKDRPAGRTNSSISKHTLNNILESSPQVIHIQILGEQRVCNECRQILHHP